MPQSHVKVEKNAADSLPVRTQVDGKAYCLDAQNDACDTGDRKCKRGSHACSICDSHGHGARKH